MLKYYYDLMSQPSRALYIAFKLSKLPVEFKPVNLAKGEHMTDEFAKLNRFKKVPIIDHNGFVLTERLLIKTYRRLNDRKKILNVSIVQYLGQLNMLPENLYPSDVKQRAKVNEFLSWQQFGIRAPCALYFIYTKILPMMTGQPPNEKQVSRQKVRMEEALEIFEEKWIGLGHKFILGDKLTIADIFASCEIEQPRMSGYDPREGRPNISAWMTNVKEELNPYYDEAHIIVNKIANKQATKDSAKSKL